MSEPKFDGEKIKLGGEDYIVPPLSLRQIRKTFKDDILLLQNKSGSEDAMIDAMLRIIHGALSRNYPDIKIEFLEEVIDTGNIIAVVSAVMNISGFVKKLGEMQAGNVQTGT